ncbi:hypothetical protein SAMCFNEI73_Ch3665 [Sinorhizobium americanum]|uniref:Uncharacterized protein n=1 Tax=Sinorhizobium americanum TaxID=194963 RepID=A0A1L3LS59_9HYPH|nr:hypothetical protein SAMCCGM7_Ch3563 [Sinorhizobium americanum CCGM7]APG92915.1 hypothetical protein SAMCFNEI73_Ch3665 [Sinorhizobium americanum]
MRSTDDSKDADLPADFGDAPKLDFLSIPIEVPPSTRTSYLGLPVARQRAFAEADQPRALERRAPDHLAYCSCV